MRRVHGVWWKDMTNFEAKMYLEHEVSSSCGAGVQCLLQSMLKWSWSEAILDDINNMKNTSWVCHSRRCVWDRLASSWARDENCMDKRQICGARAHMKDFVSILLR